MNRSMLAMFVMAGSMVAASGCTLSGGLYAEDPQYQEVQTSEAPPQTEPEAAPPPRSGYVWIKGHWQWNGARWVWTSGRWSTYRSGYNWVPGHWQRTPAGGYRWVPGHWRR